MPERNQRLTEYSDSHGLLEKMFYSREGLVKNHNEEDRREVNTGVLSPGNLFFLYTMKKSWVQGPSEMATSLEKWENI